MTTLTRHRCYRTSIRSRLLAGVVVVVCPGLLAGSEGVQDAIRELHASRPRQAEAMLRRILAAHPEAAEAWKWLGVTYASQSRHDAAEGPFRQACRLAPEDPDACYFLGRCLYAQNRFEPALAILSAALTKDGKPARVLLSIAQSMEALGRDEEAERKFRAAIEAPSVWTRPEDHPGLHFGVFLIRQGRAGEAAKVLSAVIREADSARARFETGRVQYQLDRMPAAIEELKRAVEKDPEYGEAHLLLGKAYSRIGKMDEAARHTEQGSRLIKAREQ